MSFQAEEREKTEYLASWHLKFSENIMYKECLGCFARFKKYSSTGFCFQLFASAKTLAVKFLLEVLHAPFQNCF